MSNTPRDKVLEKFGRLTPKQILSCLEEDILEHLKMLEEIFKELFENSSAPLSSKLTLNKYLLRETIESYFCDAYRLKFFREIHNEDIHKRAAFLMVWIVKIRPVQYIQGTFPNKKQDLFVNEMYAIYAGLSILQVSPHVFRVGLEGYCENLLYLLHNHAVCPEQLASEMFLLDRLALTIGAKTISANPASFSS
jgi:hypothetical protein